MVELRSAQKRALFWRKDWTLSRREKLQKGKLMPSNLDRRCLEHPPVPGVPVCALDSTNDFKLISKAE